MVLTAGMARTQVLSNAGASERGKLIVRGSAGQHGAATERLAAAGALLPAGQVDADGIRIPVGV